MPKTWSEQDLRALAEAMQRIQALGCNCLPLGEIAVTEEERVALQEAMARGTFFKGSRVHITAEYSETGKPQLVVLW